MTLLSSLESAARLATQGEWKQGVVSGRCRKPSHGKSNHPGEHSPDPCVYDYTIYCDDKRDRCQVVVPPNITLIGTDANGPILNEANASHIALACPENVLKLCARVRLLEDALNATINVAERIQLPYSAEEIAALRDVLARGGR